MWPLEIFVFLLQCSVCAPSMFARREEELTGSSFERSKGPRVSDGLRDVSRPRERAVFRVVGVFIVRPFAVVDLDSANGRTEFLLEK